MDDRRASLETMPTESVTEREDPSLPGLTRRAVITAGGVAAAGLIMGAPTLAAQRGGTHWHALRSAPLWVPRQGDSLRLSFVLDAGSTWQATVRMRIRLGLGATAWDLVEDGIVRGAWSITRVPTVRGLYSGQIVVTAAGQLDRAYLLCSLAIIRNGRTAVATDNFTFEHSTAP